MKSGYFWCPNPNSGDLFSLDNDLLLNRNKKKRRAADPQHGQAFVLRWTTQRLSEHTGYETQVAIKLLPAAPTHGY